MIRSLAKLLLLATLLVPQPAFAAPTVAGSVSFFKQILPLMHGKCQMCHQPASAGGGLILTDYAALMHGGEHGIVVVAGKPADSPLMDYLIGRKTLMPKGGPSLAPEEIALFRQWIAGGARNDTPAQRDPIDAAHPPVYGQPPVITALAYSPDGKTLAVSGYRESILWRSDGSGIAARLVGASQKVLSLVYSPDGSTLVAAGGTPALFGEVQFWDTKTARLINAARNGYDTVYGASISPDGKQVAFGCTDNTVRAVSVPDGKQILRFENHSDWPLATVFATDGKHLLSAGRDQAIKLVLLDGPTGSFIDDINTHTSPLRCLARNPKADQVACGGDDGIPRIYKVYRTEARTMNQEDHNLIHAFPLQPAPVTAIAYSPDAGTIAAGCEQGIVNLYKATDGAHVVTLTGNQGTIYAIAYSPDGRRIATGGFDGTVRIYDPATGKLITQFVPVPIVKGHERTIARAQR